MELDKMILNVNERSIIEELDRVDEIMMYTMNIIRKNIEGPNQTVLFSIKKLLSRTKVLFQKSLKAKSQGKIIDNDLMRRRGELLDIIDIEMEHTVINDKIIEAKKEQKGIKENRVKY